MTQRKYLLFFLLILAVLLVLSGCAKKENIPATAVPTEPLPTREAATIEVVDQSPVCTNDFEYLDDVNYPDGTVVAPGTVFTKEWEVRNTGNCEWTDAYKLRFISGDEMGANDTISVSKAAVGAKTHLSVELKAPDKPGTYRSEWKLFGADNRSFGQRVYVEIVVQ